MEAVHTATRAGNIRAALVMKQSYESNEGETDTTEAQAETEGGCKEGPVVVKLVKR
jgi:hypothetical protein